MIVGRNKRLAEEALTAVADHVQEPSAQVSATVAIGWALLEVAFQVGRLADRQPVFGPPEER